MYESYDNLHFRIKYTGWEKSLKETDAATLYLRKNCREAFQTFLTWRTMTLRYKKKVEDRLEEHLTNTKVYDDWTKYKLLTGLEYVEDNLK